MRISLTFLFVIVRLMSYAQPQFTNNTCYQLGDSTSLGFALVLEGFDNFIPQTGNNFTWDFSGTGFPGPWGTWSTPTIPYVFQPSSQSTHIPFQSTQINEFSNVGMPRDQFYSYSAAYDTLYYHGYYAGGTSYVYYVPLPYFVFPMNYSDSVSVSRPITNATGAIQTGSVTRNWKYDGFGTIKFPYGIENNVYRIHSYQIDSLVVNGIFISATTTEELLWIKQSDGIPVLRFQKQGASSLYAWYATATGTTSIYDLDKSQTVIIYPNPSSDFLYLHSENSLEGLHYKIADYSGRVILNGDLNSTNESIDIRDLAAGYYLLQTGESSKLKFKVIKR